MENRIKNWLKLKSKLETEDLVLISENKDESTMPNTNELVDLKYAVDSILIPEILKRVKENFNPNLECTGDFYEDFGMSYYYQIPAVELAAFEDFTNELYTQNNLEDKNYRALLSMDLHSTLSEYGPPSSREIFPILAFLARGYENSLKEAMGAKYTEDLFFKNLKNFFPKLLLVLISMQDDMFMSFMDNAESKEGKEDKNGGIFLNDFVLDKDILVLDKETLEPKLNPNFLSLIKKDIVIRKDYFEPLSRKVDRRCPFLYTENNIEFIEYAIDELVMQYRQYNK